MPDLNHSNKGEQGFGPSARFTVAQGNGLVTFGARNAEESLPFWMELVEQ
jgi:hypothetical protein